MKDPDDYGSRRATVVKNRAGGCAKLKQPTHRDFALRFAGGLREKPDPDAPPTGTSNTFGWFAPKEKDLTGYRTTVKADRSPRVSLRAKMAACRARSNA
jgi:hypothetical protein